MKFSEKLIELRKQKGLSQEDLGNMIDVSRQTVSKWEAEQTIPEVDKVKELSKVFNVSIEYLLNDEYDKVEKHRKNSKKIVLKVIIPITLIIITVALAIMIGYRFKILKKYSAKLIELKNNENIILHAVAKIEDDKHQVNTSNMVKYKIQGGNKYLSVTAYDGVLSDIRYIDVEKNELIDFERSKENEPFKMINGNETYEIGEGQVIDYVENYKEEYLNPILNKMELENVMKNTLNLKYKISSNESQIILEYKNLKLYFNKDTEMLEKIEEFDEKYDTNTTYYYEFSKGKVEVPLRKPTLEMVNKENFGIADLVDAE